MLALRLFVFFGAFLLFTMEPMIGRLLLPHFGGAFHVWTTALMFFQSVLFLSYLYAHLVAPRIKGAHLGLLLVPLLALPPVATRETQPGVIGLLLALASASALPFAVLATTSVVAQRWLADSKYAARTNPYSLYATSNIGSLVALVAYALVIEPRVGLATQRLAFSIAFGIWILTGFAAYRATQGSGSGDSTSAMPKGRSGAGEAIAPGRILFWLVLSACGSALFMGVTNVITMEAGNAPLIWVIPLVLYLFTFVVAFNDPQRVPGWVLRLWPHFALVALYFATGASADREIWQVVLQLIVYFVIALAVQAELYASRPPPRDLTLFYLVLSLGGGLGGAFVALVAPQAFQSLAEYPITVVVVLLTILYGKRAQVRRWLASGERLAAVSFIGLALLLGGRYLVAEATANVAGGSIATARSFYGVYHVLERKTDHGPLRTLISGLTTHGSQFMEAPYRADPRTYFHRDGPLGEVMEILRRRGRPRNLGVIGLGVGSAAAYVEPGEMLTFFEIDALDVQLARDHFHFLDDCRGQVNTIVGDARVTLEKLSRAPSPPRYDLLLVDAFSGDAIPTHLMTREAIELYRRLLAPDGYLLLHVSNRYFDLRPALAATARELRLPAAWRQRRNPTGLEENPTEYVVFPPSEAALTALTNAGWTSVSAGRLATVDSWTDDRSNTLAAFR